MTRIVASLAEAGMVTRVADTNDRRSARVRCDAIGRATLERMRTRRTPSCFAGWASSSADEQRQAAELVALLEHLLEEP